MHVQAVVMVNHLLNHQNQLRQNIHCGHEVRFLLIDSLATSYRCYIHTYTVCIYDNVRVRACQFI